MRSAFNEHNVIHARLLRISFLKKLIQPENSLFEKVHSKFFELSTGENLGEIFPLKEGPNLNISACLRRKDVLGSLNSMLQSLNGFQVLRNVNIVFAVIQINKEVEYALIEFPTT